MLFQRFWFREFSDHVQFSCGGVQILLKLVDRESIAFQLRVGDVAPGGQLAAVEVKVLRASRIFFRDEQFTFQLLFFLNEHAQLVFPAGDHRRFVFVLGFAVSGFDSVDRDPLSVQVFSDGRIVQLHDHITGIDGCSFGSDFEDSDTLRRRNFTPQLGIGRTFHITSLDNVDGKFPDDRLVGDHLRVSVPPKRVNGPATNRNADGQYTQNNQ